MEIWWPDPEADYPREIILPAWFESQVERTPAAVAAVTPDQTLTYADLERRANSVAQIVRRAGVAPGQVVGLFFERGPDLLAAQLGALKAGAALAAFDPAYPRAALARLLETVELPLLLTAPAWAAECPPGRFAVRMLTPADFDRPAARLPATATPVDPAVILFTSGSTGLPKAVVYTHRALAARFSNTLRLAGFTSASAFAQISPLSSIDALDEIFLPLVSGGRTVILPYALVADPHRLIRALAETEVTHCLLVPALLRVILAAETALADKLAALRVWLVGGEALTGALACQFYAALPAAQLINYYGLTEGDAACYRVPPEAQYPAQVPIGRPVQNTRLYLLDDQLRPAPPGEPGEICLAGAGLFREYLNRPELNRRVWMDNPFAEKGGPYGRLFRTGDMGRLNLAGEIEYLGRRDRLVKIRGFRVELDEVEAVCRRHPAVAEAVVVAQPAPDPAQSIQRLVAYVTPQAAGRLVDPAEVLALAREHLPDFAVPAVVVPLERLPLLPNGKVDVRQLPSAETPAPKQIVPPRNLVETQLVALWEAVLHRQIIGIHDNFFDLGGDSLAAIDLVLRLEKSFQTSLPISVLLQAPTIAELAGQVGAPTPVGWSSLVPIRPAGTRPPLFCVHADGGVMFYYRFAHRLDPELPVYGLQARGLLNSADAPLTRVEDMAAHYLQEIRQVQPRGPYHLCAYSAGGLIVLEMARQLREQGEPVNFVGLFDAYGPHYPKLLPGKTRAAYKLSVHLNTLRVHNWRGQLGYLWRRTRKRGETIYAKVVGRVCLALGRPLPHRVRYHYIARLIEAAGDRYQPAPVQAPVVLFRASLQPRNIYPDPYLGWREIVAADPVVIEVTGTHDSIMKAPHLQGLVAAVQTYLAGLEARQPR